MALEGKVNKLEKQVSSKPQQEQDRRRRIELQMKLHDELYRDRPDLKKVLKNIVDLKCNIKQYETNGQVKPWLDKQGFNLQSAKTELQEEIRYYCEELREYYLEHYGYATKEEILNKYFVE